MKYVFVWEVKEPFNENFKKAMEIQKGRIDKGEVLGKAMVYPIHSFMSENKAFMIVETDDVSIIAKWAADYGSVFKYKIIPIVEWCKISKYWLK